MKCLMKNNLLMAVGVFIFFAVVKGLQWLDGSCQELVNVFPRIFNFLLGMLL